MQNTEESVSGSLSNRAYRKLFMSRLATTSLIRDSADAQIRTRDCELPKIH